MMRSIMSRWIGPCLLAALMVAGCNQAQRQPRMVTHPTQTSQVYVVPPGTTVVTQLPDAQAAVPDPTPGALPPAPPAPPKGQEMQPAGYTMSSEKEETVKRRSYGDVTAKPCFGHADNYTWLKGELQHLANHDVWDLRYASVDEDDKYGGHVVLVEVSRMSELKSGQTVRVEGEVLEPDGKESGSQRYRFRVRSIEPIEN